MAFSSTSRASSPVAELSFEQVFYPSDPLVERVMDCSDPLVERVLDYSEPIVATSTEAPTFCSSIQALNSSEPTDGPSSSSSARRIKPRKDEYLSQWNSRKVFACFGTHDQCVAFAESLNLLPMVKMCSYHKAPMKLVRIGHLGIFRCFRSRCKNKSVSRAFGTLFENAHLPLPIIFEIMYFFSHSCNYDYIKRECCGTDRGKVLSSRTISDWIRYCRETVIVYELEHQSPEPKIGGMNKIVQIDESRFAKRKYNRGSHLDGHWLIGMIEDKSDDLRLEICPDNEQSAEVLVPLFKKHVAEGSIIVTDFGRNYDCLAEHGFIIKKSNHSDPEHPIVATDGVQTQRLESQWRVLKQLFKKDNYNGNFSDWLVEYSWRRKISINHNDCFAELLKAVEYVYKIN